MTDQPDQGHDGHSGGHDPYGPHDQYGRPRYRTGPPEEQARREQARREQARREQARREQARREREQQAWPGGQQVHDDPYAAQQYTQQWQGQTWETQMQPPVPPAAAEETSYLPPLPPPQPQTGQAPRAARTPAGHAGYTGQGDQGTPWAGPAGHGAPPPRGAPFPASASPVAPPVPHAPPPPVPPAPPPGVPGDSGYGPATLAGNTRVTDAQRARAEGRSPVIEPGMQPAVLTALLGVLIAGGAALGTYALLVPLVALQGLTAAGWFRLNGMWPARQGIALGFLGALVADAALLVSGRSPAAVLGTLGVWVLLSLVLQLRSHADADERMYGLTATVAAAALAIMTSGYLAAGADAATIGGIAVAAAVVARAVPLPRPTSVVVALLVAAGAGVLVGGLTGFGTPGVLVGVGAAVCALIGHRAASYDYPSRFVHFTAGVALPLAASAPAVYALGRVTG